MYLACKSDSKILNHAQLTDESLSIFFCLFIFMSGPKSYEWGTKFPHKVTAFGVLIKLHYMYDSYLLADD